LEGDGTDGDGPRRRISDASGPFSPVTGNQLEGGVKTQLLDGRLQGNAAVYRIVRKNILQVYPAQEPVNGLDQLAPIGEVTMV
jgi:iron complex outermembrane receptor protein